MTGQLRGLSAPLRTYPTALAEQLAACRPGEVRLKLLNSLYLDLSMADKLACLAALESARRARRIEMLGGYGPNISTDKVK